MYLFFFNDTATTEIYTLSLHDALPISERDRTVREFRQALEESGMVVPMATTNLFTHPIFKDGADRKSTRLNSSHANISYAVFCLKKKTHKSRPAVDDHTQRTDTWCLNP